MLDHAAASAISHRTVAGQILALIVIRGAGTETKLRALVLERLDSADVNGGRQAAGDQRGVLYFGDIRSREHLGGIDFPTKILRGFGGGDLAAIHQSQDQARAQSADGRLTGIAAIPSGIDAGQSVELFRNGDIGKLTDIGRGDIVADEV